MTHVTRQQLDRLRDGTLPPAELAEVGRHAASCPACGPEVAAAFDVDRVVRDLRVQLEADGDVEHLSPDELMAHADGVEHAHVSECDACREEVDELRRLQSAIRGRRRAWWPYAAAAAIAFLALLGIVIDRDRSTPAPERPAIARRPPAATAATPAGYGREDWDQWVAEAKKARTLSVPPIVERLRPPDARFRGAADRTDLGLSPNATAVTSARPRFRWSERESSTYNVILQLGDRIAESGPVTEPGWTPASDLKWGEEYSWQLEVIRGDDRVIYPRAPKPPARFRVIEWGAMQEIEAARAQHPADPLLHAVLLARHGAREEALDALERLAETDPELAAELRRSLAKWP